jgi:DNA-binding MarR family transcriptional regulator
MDPLLEILRCARLAEGALSMEYRAIGLAPLHALILAVVYVDGPSSHRRLVRRLGCADSTLSSAVRRLEDRGLVRRVRDPGRVSTPHLALTRPGRLMASWVWDTLAVVNWRLAFDEDGRSEVLARLAAALDEMLRDRRGLHARRARSHRRYEDPLLE